MYVHPFATMLFQDLVDELVVDAMLWGGVSMVWCQGASRVDVAWGLHCGLAMLCGRFCLQRRDRERRTPCTKPKGRPAFLSFGLHLGRRSISTLLAKGDLWPSRREWVLRGGYGWLAPNAQGWINLQAHSIVRKFVLNQIYPPSMCFLWSAMHRALTDCLGKDRNDTVDK